MTDITEKKLAEKLQDCYRRTPTTDNAWERIAHHAAELLGVTLAPEKPEPGTYFYYFVTGIEPVVIDEDATMTPLSNVADFLHFGHYDPENLTPARVVPKADLEQAEGYRDALALERDQRKAKAEARGEAVRGYAAEPPVLTKEQVGGMWDEYRDNAQWSWASRGPAMWRMMTATVNAALAKHGGARELPGRDELRDAISNAQSLKVPPRDIEAAANAVMDLLGGGDRG